MSQLLCTQDISFNEPSKEIREFVEDFTSYLENKVIQVPDTSVSLGWRESTKSEIYEIFDECSGEGWDGYDALPISADTIENAIRFIHFLPNSTLPPEVAAEPDGDVAIEWKKAGVVFSVSLDDDTLIYTGIFGSSQKRGKERFLDEIPKAVNSIILQHFLKY